MMTAGLPSGVAVAPRRFDSLAKVFCSVANAACAPARSLVCRACPIASKAWDRLELEKGLAVAVRSILSDCREIAESLLCGAQVAAPERTAQLLQVGAAALIEILNFLEDRAGDRL
jgi:hypothetical protein